MFYCFQTTHCLFFIVYFTDRNDKPTLTCPDSKTFMVTSRNSETYDYNEDVTFTGNIISVNPSIIRSSVDKIGTMELITITAANEFNTESSCTYMVHFVGEFNYCNV
jgi:hypothetical protein